MKWVWAGWLFVIAASFGAFEWYALSRPDGLTLSQFVVDVGYAWPPIIFLLGMLVGGLLVHFAWPWVPKQRREVCEICGRTILIDPAGG